MRAFLIFVVIIIAGVIFFISLTFISYLLVVLHRSDWGPEQCGKVIDPQTRMMLLHWMLYK